MVTISRDTPCLYLTAVTKDRLPVFRTDALKKVACDALSEARQSGGFSIFAYVMMPDHLHVLTDSVRKPSDVLRFAKGIVSHRIIEYLKEQGYESSLEKLRHEKQARQYKYSLWQHHSNVMLLTRESTFMQRVHYTHLNPVRAGLVERAEDYRWSSVRCWSRHQTDDEPLMVDIDQIKWQSGKA
ncbi:MAG TPA: transposase [Pyrinomonadaceae bacterium]|jgi:REP element-mobilizing transposase RayT